MSLLSAVHDGALAAGVASLLYAGTVTTAALTALLAPSPARRRAGREVLTILLRRGGSR
ncbi:hypothetical protein [Plantactinospora sp. CA-290183]|uniref:hypothetical protein n=1 Tax=Plantactinospora sp. CA-290183 TaxID=3240006 RepID=UPI003D8A9C47